MNPDPCALGLGSDRCHKAYVGRQLVDEYDERHFGGKGGRFVFRKDYVALESLMGTPDGVILDIPCGTGIYSEALRESGVNVVAADASLQMLEKVGERSRGVPRVLCDAAHLPFVADVFDAVITIRLLQHLSYDDVTDLLLEARRVSKPGGRVIFDTFRWTPRRVALLRRFRSGEMTVYSHRQVHSLLQNARLRQVQVASHYLFSPILYRRLPVWFLRSLAVIEWAIPQRWLLRSFWACTKD